jgi:predicted metal-dependent HD superfamily phosphohydrolase
VRHLAEAWLRTAARVGARDDVAGSGANLLARYAEAGRHYHDLTHLDEVLRNVDELADAARDPDVVRLAAWFHDAVYDPRADDNEENSARLAEKVLTALRVDEALVAQVARLVRLTADHLVGDDDPDAAVLCDADLAILASEAGRYADYAAGVRAEYAHVPDADFARGRTAVLRHLLDQPSLFHTPTAHATWEAPARANMKAELARLATPRPP